MVVIQSTSGPAHRAGRAWPERTSRPWGPKQVGRHPAGAPFSAAFGSDEQEQGCRAVRVVGHRGKLDDKSERCRSHRGDDLQQETSALKDDVDECLGSLNPQRSSAG